MVDFALLHLGCDEGGCTLRNFFTTSSPANVKDTVSKDLWVIAILLKVFATNRFCFSLCNFGTRHAEK